MLKDQSILTRCFAFLCFGTALGMVGMQWHDPLAPKDTVDASASTPLAFEIVTGEPVQAIRTPDRAMPFSLKSGRGVQREAVGSTQPASTITTRVVVKLGLRRLELYDDDKLVKQYSVAVGQEDWQTPIGRFTVMEMLENPAWQHPITGAIVPTGPDNPLGSRWVGFWSDGEFHIGFHGTNQEALIGQAVSHGCVRMLNADIEDLYQRIEKGTVVLVER
jgi:L,D-transpeptidase ErfK/SrfK